MSKQGLSKQGCCRLLGSSSCSGTGWANVTKWTRTRMMVLDWLLGSDHFIFGGDWKTFWKNNLGLLLAEKKIIWPSLCVEKKILLWYVAKKLICRIDRGAETAVYQAWLFKKKKSDLQFFVKKNLASNGVWKKNPVLTSTENNNLLKKCLPASPNNAMVAPLLPGPRERRHYYNMLAWKDTWLLTLLISRDGMLVN